jgi:hypothetical protein
LLFGSAAATRNPTRETCALASGNTFANCATLYQNSDSVYAQSRSKNIFDCANR